VETFAAVRLEVNSWRWQGVPFYIRAGKCLPVTCTEVIGRFRKPPNVVCGGNCGQNHFRLRINPDVEIAMGMTVMSPGEGMIGQSAEMLASRQPRVGDMDAYEKVLGDALAGDATLFAREDYVEEAWRIVDPVLKRGTRVNPYEPKTWGPTQAEVVAPAGGWHEPILHQTLADGQAA